MAQNVKFVFDLDGTLTRVETLPLIAHHFRVEEAIAELTERTIRGHIPFEDSFATRVSILGKFKVGEVNHLLGSIPLFDEILSFIQDHKEDCVVATGNLDVWISTLLGRVGCMGYSSQAQISDGQITGIKSILHKAQVVTDLQAQGHYVVFVGDGDNDAAAMRAADCAIACGLVHEPAETALQAADHIVHDERHLLDLLQSIQIPAE